MVPIGSISCDTVPLLATVQYTVLCHACLQYCTVSCTSTIQYCNVPSMFKVPYCALHVYSAVQCHICLLYLTCVPGVSAVSACAGVEAPPGGGVGPVTVAQVPLPDGMGCVTSLNGNQIFSKFGKRVIDNKCCHKFENISSIRRIVNAKF